MAAIPNAGGARSAPRVVIRALLRVLLLGGLVAVGWLLGSGISYADEDLGQPGTGLIRIANVVSSDDGSDDVLGPSAAVLPTVNRVLSTAAVPRVPVEPLAQVNVLRPIVEAVGIAKPLERVLPVSRPLSVPAQHLAPARQQAAIPAAAQVDKPAIAQLSAPATVKPSPLAPTAVVHVKPTACCSPAQAAAEPLVFQPALGDAPMSPIPANPPGSTTSPCTIGGAGGGGSSKNGFDVAVHTGWMTDGLAQPYGLFDRDTSGLPRSLSVQPSTSPD